MSDAAVLAWLHHTEQRRLAQRCAAIRGDDISVQHPSCPPTDHHYGNSRGCGREGNFVGLERALTAAAVSTQQRIRDNSKTRRKLTSEGHQVDDKRVQGWFPVFDSERIEATAAHDSEEEMGTQ
ncbi:unnamed protein product [Arctogadus glacialis]